ncbi:MAG: ABC transporter ATP-binding protein, partial [Lachnospiraceae bacterium]|nr:ABC transporter ATP-binding protein [Lachnospiraceae bacterium]
MLKKLLAQVKEYKTASILTPICMIFEVIFEVAIPVLMGSIVDDGIVKGDMDHIVKMGLLMLVLALCGLASGILG